MTDILEKATVVYKSMDKKQKNRFDALQWSRTNLRDAITRRHACPAKLCEDGAPHLLNKGKQMLRYCVDLDPQRRERAQHMTKYVKSPDPE